MNKKVVILGGGISGLSVAWKLSKQGIPVCLIEQEEFIGGVAGSFRKGDYVFDYGPHSFFSDDDEIIQTVFDLFPHGIPSVKRKAKLFFNNKLLDYPLSAKSVLFQMGFMNSLLCVLGYLRVCLKPNSGKKHGNDEYPNIKEWATDNFGEYLFKIFFKPYTEAFWKIPTERLSQRIIPSNAKLSFVNTLKHLLIKQYLHVVKREPGTLSMIERESLPSYYPVGGFGEISEKISDTIHKNGGHTLLGSRVESVEKSPKGRFVVKFIHNDSGDSMAGDYVVSTIPITNLLSMLKPSAPKEVLDRASRLKYLSLIVINIITNKQDILNCQYSYFLHRPYHRISEMNKFSEKTSPDGENILSVEMSCYDNDPTWNLSDQALFDESISALENDHIIKREEVNDVHIMRIPDVYPVYTCDYHSNLNTMLNYVAGIEKLTTIGRMGEFYYGDIDIMMKRGFDIADRIKAQLS